jgi:hypothetical protein
MKSVLILCLLLIISPVVLSCGERRTSGAHWILKSQDHIPQVAPQMYRVCIPVGVRPQNASFMAAIQFIFEEKFSFMEVDWDFNGKGIDYAADSSSNSVTLLLHDYHGRSNYNWSPMALNSEAVLSALVRSDKRLHKVNFVIATIRVPLNNVPGCTRLNR